MRRVPLLVASLVLAGSFVLVPAEADVAWSKPGWYVEVTMTGFDIALVSGPYASKADCQPNIPTDQSDGVYACNYEQTDPNAGGGS